MRIWTVGDRAALIGTRLTVTGDMICDGVTTVGGIILTGASIGGFLRVQGCASGR